MLVSKIQVSEDRLRSAQTHDCDVLLCSVCNVPKSDECACKCLNSVLGHNETGVFHLKKGYNEIVFKWIVLFANNTTHDAANISRIGDNMNNIDNV